MLLFLFLCQFHYRKEGSYTIGTVGFEDVDCQFVDFTYVSQTVMIYLPLFDCCAK